MANPAPLVWILHSFIAIPVTVQRAACGRSAKANQCPEINTVSAPPNRRSLVPVHHTSSQAAQRQRNIYPFFLETPTVRPRRPVVLEC
jgi:hypothetical protein